MSYNLTSLGSSTTVTSIVTWTNDASGGIMVGLFMLTLFFILMTRYTKLDMTQRLAVSSFICAVLSLFLVYTNIFNFKLTLAFFLITALTSLYLYATKQG